MRYYVILAGKSIVHRDGAVCIIEAKNKEEAYGITINEYRRNHGLSPATHVYVHSLFDSYIEEEARAEYTKIIDSIRDQGEL